MQYYLKCLRQFKIRSISIIIILLATAVNVKAQSILEVSSGATIVVSTGADICADSIIGIIQGEGTICGGINSIYSETETEIPKVFALHQNYPNPFNPSTTIYYSVPTTEFITLKVYDPLGNEVAILVNEEKLVGTYEITWYAASATGGLASGIYFYRLQAGSFVETKKMILLK